MVAAAPVLDNRAMRHGEWEARAPDGEMKFRLCIPEHFGLGAAQSAMLAASRPKCRETERVRNGALTVNTSLCELADGTRISTRWTRTQLGLSAYVLRYHTHIEGGPNKFPDSDTTITMRWRGRCQPDDMPATW